MVPDTIEREITIKAPVERVWTLLTEAEHLGRWFGNTGAEVDLRPGGTLRLHWAGHPSAFGRVEVVEPPRRFAYRWLTNDVHDESEPTDGNSTLVEFTLAQEGEATRLRVRESGFAALSRTDEGRRGYREGNVRGWGEKTAALAEYAERVAT